MDLDEIMNSTGFWILGGAGVGCEVAGWIMSKKFGASLPIWQLLVMIVVTLIAAAYFGTRD